ncbi:OLC1v1030970C1 [Oldenlandia corymbosa var. corymbosa]|uniref:OLC1v1030970C1 n=1 Tax=Oldenlandia corymbosa var. corymbosa TaxID=529605 RepID=A0AAV1CKC3_OLDCO|nr:OLC1v1030970C1 [Oldenlandia corymbosa var. corymbosa]
MAFAVQTSSGVRPSTRVAGDAAALISPANSKQRGRGSWRNLLCSHCHNTGHEVSECFQLIGYPKNWPLIRSNSGGGGVEKVADLVTVLNWVLVQQARLVWLAWLGRFLVQLFILRFNRFLVSVRVFPPARLLV